MSGKPPMRGRAARLARLLPSGPASAARTPFVLLVVVLLGGGLIALLLLNSSLSQGSFRLSKLKKETTELTDQQQELQREVDGYAAPGSLEQRARELGMVPGGNPAFLTPDGKVRGTPGPAAVAVPIVPRSPSPAAGPKPSPTGTPSGSPSAPAIEPSRASSPPSGQSPSAPKSPSPAPSAGTGAAPTPSTDR